MDVIIVKVRCKACNGTGDFRGKKGLGDDPSLYWLCHGDFRCLHCNGTGDATETYHNTCKYCGQPCNGYCCPDCYEDFEGDGYSDDEEE